MFAYYKLIAGFSIILSLSKKPKHVNCWEVWYKYTYTRANIYIWIVKVQIWSISDQKSYGVLENWAVWTKSLSSLHLLLLAQVCSIASNPDNYELC